MGDIGEIQGRYTAHLDLGAAAALAHLARVRVRVRAGVIGTIP